MTSFLIEKQRRKTSILTNNALIDYVQYRYWGEEKKKASKRRYRGALATPAATATATETRSQRSNRFNEQNNNFARAARFLADFLAIPARPRREISLCDVSWGTLTQKEECFFLFVHLGAVPKKSTPGKFTYRVHLAFFDEVE